MLADRGRNGKLGLGFLSSITTGDHPGDHNYRLGINEKYF